MNVSQFELDIEGIERLCDRATSGNVSHTVGCIKSYCRCMKEELNAPDWKDIRNHAAIAAMKGLLSNPALVDEKGLDYRIDIVNTSVFYADELVEKLKK